MPKGGGTDRKGREMLVGYKDHGWEMVKPSQEMQRGTGSIGSLPPCQKSVLPFLSFCEKNQFGFQLPETKQEPNPE